MLLNIMLYNDAQVQVAYLFFTGLRSLGPALQYLAGDLAVEADTVLPVQASHNTV